MIRVKIAEEDEYEAHCELGTTPIRRHADLSDEAAAVDILGDLWRIAKSDTLIRFTWLPKPSLGGRLSAFL